VIGKALEEHCMKGTNTTDVVIIGGGVIGCSIAYYLRRSGVDVTVLDSGEIGAQASGAAAGLLAPLGPLPGPGALADLVLASWKMFPALVQELEAASDLSLEYEQTGALRIVRGAKNISNLSKRLRAWQPLGLEMHWLDATAIHQREPILAADVCAAVYAPQEAQLRATRVVQAFARAAARQGAVLCGQCEILGLRRQGKRVTGVYTAQGETLACNRLVVASGAWAADCGIWMDLPLPVNPQRGQILALRQPPAPLHHLVFGEAIYLAPKKDSTIIVGATREEVGFDKHITAGGIAWLLSTAIRLAPALDGCVIDRIWAGIRPKTPDNQPVLGPAPGWENVTLAVGHGSVGVMLSPITGRSIAELLVTGEVSKLIKAFSLERFT
jgi:glycine oxidase